MTRLAFLFLLTLVGCSTTPVETSTPQVPALDREIEYYRSKIEQFPRSYALYPLLADVYLRKARVGSNVTAIKKAHELLQTSLAIQPNTGAFKGMAALQNYRHRFAEALTWANRAADTFKDSEIIGLKVESLLGLGKSDDAKALLFGQTAPPDFNIFASIGQWHEARQEYNAAADAFKQAASVAKDQGASRQYIWAITNIAGMYLDSGRPEQAKPYLETAQHADPKSRDVSIHWAEYYTLTQEPAKALTIYEDLLKAGSDPSISYRSFLIARKLGLNGKSHKHFDNAKLGFLDTIKSGEIFALEGLARLYCEANRELSQAMKFAQENLRYKRDRHALDVLECIHKKMSLVEIGQELIE